MYISLNGMLFFTECLFQIHAVTATQPILISRDNLIYRKKVISCSDGLFSHSHSFSSATNQSIQMNIIYIRIAIEKE